MITNVHSGFSFRAPKVSTSTDRAPRCTPIGDNCVLAGLIVDIHDRRPGRDVLQNAGDSQNFALVQIKRYAVRMGRLGTAEIDERECGALPCAGYRPTCHFPLQLLPNHTPHEFVMAGLAVAQNCDAVTNAEDLVQMMQDEDHRDFAVGSSRMRTRLSVISARATSTIPPWPFYNRRINTASERLVSVTIDRPLWRMVQFG